ncbi:MAG: hypothetical protein CM1200mP2_46470 [Planctomycetaceae bacterium]|nr:MAG: hypothetical protein CM1200mP2_46470 [Planctomycetaceae bacterium]
MHSVWVDSDYRVYICDREKTGSNCLTVTANFWRNGRLLPPDKLWFDKDETIFMAEVGHR